MRYHFNTILHFINKYCDECFILSLSPLIRPEQHWLCRKTSWAQQVVNVRKTRRCVDSFLMIVSSTDWRGYTNNRQGWGGVRIAIFRPAYPESARTFNFKQRPKYRVGCPSKIPFGITNIPHRKMKNDCFNKFIMVCHPSAERSCLRQKCM